MSNKKVAIIGAGPAGITASIYLKRAGIEPVLFEMGGIGGAILKASEISNYPGVGALKGFELAMKFMEELKRYSITPIIEKVENIDENLHLKTNKNEYNFDGIIIATGAKMKLLKLPSEAKFRGKGISYCATCDGFFFKEKVVAVIGTSFKAIDSIKYLSAIVNKLYWFIDTETPPIDVNTFSNVEVVKYKKIIEFSGSDKLENIKFIDVNDEEKITDINGCFVNLGEEGNSSFINFIEKNEDNFIKVNNLMQTSHPKIYAAGDVVEKRVYQVATAVGEGATAAEILREELL